LNKELELEQAVHDAKAAAAKAYYAVLVAREGVENLEKLLPVLEENFRQVKALQENGFADITDVNRQELGVGELNTQLLVLRNKEFSAMDMLHFLLGMPLKTPIELTSELEELLQDPDPRTLAAAAFDENQHIDSRVAESLVVLQQLTVKNERAANLPKFYGFLSHQQNAYRREFDIFSNGPWYPTTILGVNLQIPIYSGGIRHQKIQQARIAEEQVMLNQEIVNQQLLLDVSQMQKAVLDAADQYDFQKRNMELATDIFERTNAKYREGVASSFELTEERTQLLNSNNAYTQSLADLLLARANLRKALGIF
jgi:outer membrane protein TolC